MVYLLVLVYLLSFILLIRRLKRKHLFNLVDEFDVFISLLPVFNTLVLIFGVFGVIADIINGKFKWRI